MSRHLQRARLCPFFACHGFVDRVHRIHPAARLARRPGRRPLEGLRRSVSRVVGHPRSICPREASRRARRRVGAAHLGTKPVTPPARPRRRRWRRLGRPTQGVHQGAKSAMSVFGASNLEGISRQNARRPPRQMLRYLARYVHRVAIGDSRLVDLNDTSVPPRGCVRIRSGGFLANTVKRDRLVAIRQALGVAAHRRRRQPRRHRHRAPIAAPPWCNGSKCCRACRLNPCSGGPTPHETPTQSRQASPSSPTWGRGPVAGATPPPPTATRDASTSQSATANAAVFRGRFRVESP